MDLLDQEKIIKIRAMTRFHFIAGLPMSGASLLAAILGQNPRFVAPGASQACELLGQTVQMFSDRNPLNENLKDGQKVAFWRGVLDSIYHDRPFDSVVFDVNRDWLHYTDLLVRLFPLSRFILCVRNPASIVNSMEDKGILATLSATGDRDDAITNLISKNGLLGLNIDLLRRSLAGEHTERMFVLDYDRLVDDPEEVMDVLYDFLREPDFNHDFSELNLAVPSFENDEPSIISGPVVRSDRPMHLPARTVQQLSGRAFWRNLRRSGASMMLGRAL